LFQCFGVKELQPVTDDQYIGILDIGHAWATFALYTRAGLTVCSRTVSFKRFDQKKKTDTVLPDAIVDILVEVVEETMLYFDRKDVLPSLIILAGVEAVKRELVDALNKKMKKTDIRLMGDCVKVKSYSEKDMQKFGAAIGAALRAARPHSFVYQPNFINTLL
ncbi:MAG: hypothetical protein AAB664_04635, partial [Patescibacteria group bacterium]